MSEWSLEKELCRISNSKTHEEALLKLGLINEKNDKYTIQRDSDWTRGGAETYIYRFWVSHDNGSEEGYIIKACVAFEPNSNLDKILSEWVKRRKLLASKGVKTPRLLSYGEGVILEELIPHRLKDLLVSQPESNQKLLNDLAYLAAILSALGFEPIDAFHDLRSRGNDIVVIDFGQDLGPPGISNAESFELYTKLLEKLNEWGLILSARVTDEMYSHFLSSLLKK